MNESDEEEGRASGRGRPRGSCNSRILHAFREGPHAAHDGERKRRTGSIEALRHSQPNDEIARNGEGREPPSTRGAPFEIQ